MALLAEPEKHQEPYPLGTIRANVGGHISVTSTQDRPRNLMACRVANVMRQGCADALVTEEPYEGILHVRVCGGTGRETAGPTRQQTGAEPVWHGRAAVGDGRST